MRLRARTAVAFALPGAVACGAASSAVAPVGGDAGSSGHSSNAPAVDGGASADHHAGSSSRTGASQALDASVADAPHARTDATVTDAPTGQPDAPLPDVFTGPVDGSGGIGLYGTNGRPHRPRPPRGLPVRSGHPHRAVALPEAQPAHGPPRAGHPADRGERDERDAPSGHGVRVSRSPHLRPLGLARPAQPAQHAERAAPRPRVARASRGDPPSRRAPGLSRDRPTSGGTRCLVRPDSLAACRSLPRKTRTEFPARLSLRDECRSEWAACAPEWGERRSERAACVPKWAACRSERAACVPEWAARGSPRAERLS